MELEDSQLIEEEKICVLFMDGLALHVGAGQRFHKPGGKGKLFY